MVSNLWIFSTESQDNGLIGDQSELSLFTTTVWYTVEQHVKFISGKENAHSSPQALLLGRPRTCSENLLLQVSKQTKKLEIDMSVPPLLSAPDRVSMAASRHPGGRLNGTFGHHYPDVRILNDKVRRRESAAPPKKGRYFGFAFMNHGIHL